METSNDKQSKAAAWVALCRKYGLDPIEALEMARDRQLMRAIGVDTGATKEG